jgi:membrane protein YqaA with SNARE-associated domain
MQIVAAALGILVLLFVVIIAGTVIGGFVGWIVGLFFPFVIAALNQLTGLELTAFEMGAVLGFVSAFFRSSPTTGKN